MAPKKQTLLKKLKTEDLVAAAEDMTKVMDLDPPIDTSLKKADLLDAIIQDAEVVEVSDELQNSTWDILTQIGCKAALQRKKEPEVAQKAAEAKKNAGKKKASAGKKTGKPAGEKPNKRAGRKMSRSIATGMALKDRPSTKEELAKKANDIYIKAGGKDNMKEANWNVSVIVPALVASGLISIDEKGAITYNI